MKAPHKNLWIRIIINNDIFRIIQQWAIFQEHQTEQNIEKNYATWNLSKSIVNPDYQFISLLWIWLFLILQVSIWNIYSYTNQIYFQVSISWRFLGNYLENRVFQKRTMNDNRSHDRCGAYKEEAWILGHHKFSTTFQQWNGPV